jgi:hypothetical protein
VSVPWSLITKDQNKFIDKKYLPVGFIIVEPSKITKANAQSLVLHWMERIDQNFDDIFEFKGLVPKIKTRRIRDRAHQKNALAQEIVKSDAEGDDEDSEEDDEEDEEESVEENSPPLPPPKQKSRPKPVARLAIDPAPVPAAHPTTHPTKPAPDQAAQPPKPKLDIREQAPADIGDDKKARRQFLHNLSGQDQYVKLLLALDNLPEEVSSSPDDVFWLPSWVSWQYSENHLPENIHKQKKHYFTMLKWLTLPPHQLRSGLLIDQNDAEMVLLGLGMILQDLERGRYSQDIEEPNPYPQFVLETIIEDDVMDDYVLEICSRFLSKIQSLDSTSGYQLASHINRKPRSPAKVKSMPDAIINSPRKRDLYPEADNREKKRQKKDDEVSERKTRAQRSKEARKTRSGKTIH